MSQYINDKKVEGLVGNPQEQVQASAPPKHFGPKFLIAIVVVALLAGGAYAGIWWWGNKSSQVSFYYFKFDPNSGNSNLIVKGKDLGIVAYSYIKIDGEHVASLRDGGLLPHLVYDNKDYGDIGGPEVDPRIFSWLFDVADGHFVFNRTIDGINHIFYDGKDVGIGEFPKISKNHLAFSRKIDDKYHLIYDNIDQGVIYNGNPPEDLGPSYSYLVDDDNLFYLSQNKHLFRNDTDLGSAEYDVILRDLSISENHYCFVRNNPSETEPDRHLIYDGKDIGSGLLASCGVSGNNLVYQKFDHILYNGKDLGVGSNSYLADNDIVFERSVNDKVHIIFNGTDLGEGSLPLNESGITIHDIISNHNIVFIRDEDVGNIGFHKDIIYNGKDIGKGDYPKIYGNHLMYTRFPDGHLIYDGKDIGLAGSSEYGFIK